MKKTSLILALAVSCSLLCGCNTVDKISKSIWGSSVEFSKTIWGSSTRNLEKARVEAISKTFDCALEACFEKVVEMTKVDEEKSLASRMQQEEENETEDGELVTEEDGELKSTVKYNVFTPFIINREKKLIVVMGVPGNIDTTEVGIFFVPVDSLTTKIEVSSLSSSAKANASFIIFEKLSEEYKPVE